MKVAMWGVALIILGIFGVLLINLFGNITVTNQLNYTTMKNAVEAAMYDSIDIAHYRSGFCLCTNKVRDKSDNKYHFTSSSEYVIEEIVNDSCNNENYSNCDLLEGEYKIDKKVFSESMVRRFAEMVNNNKNYTFIIQDVIEYPPKVSVRVDSDDEHIFDGGEFAITNQIDAVLEEK